MTGAGTGPGPGPGPPEDPEDSEKCPICLGVLSGAELAMPDCCCHVFCLRCLLTWAELQPRPSCPVDRRPFSNLFRWDGHLTCVQVPVRRRILQADVQSYCRRNSLHKSALSKRGLRQRKEEERTVDGKSKGLVRKCNDEDPSSLSRKKVRGAESCTWSPPAFVSLTTAAQEVSGSVQDEEEELLRHREDLCKPQSCVWFCSPRPISAEDRPGSPPLSRDRGVFPFALGSTPFSSPPPSAASHFVFSGVVCALTCPRGGEKKSGRASKVPPKPAPPKRSGRGRKSQSEANAATADSEPPPQTSGNSEPPHSATSRPRRAAAPGKRKQVTNRKASGKRKTPARKTRSAEVISSSDEDEEETTKPDENTEEEESGDPDAAAVYTDPETNGENVDEDSTTAPSEGNQSDRRDEDETTINDERGENSYAQDEPLIDNERGEKCELKEQDENQTIDDESQENGNVQDKDDSTIDDERGENRDTKDTENQTTDDESQEHSDAKENENQTIDLQSPEHSDKQDEDEPTINESQESLEHTDADDEERRENSDIEQNRMSPFNSAQSSPSCLTGNDHRVKDEEKEDPGDALTTDDEPTASPKSEEVKTENLEDTMDSPKEEEMDISDEEETSIGEEKDDDKDQIVTGTKAAKDESIDSFLAGRKSQRQFDQPEKAWEKVEAVPKSDDEPKDINLSEDLSEVPMDFGSPLSEHGSATPSEEREPEAKQEKNLEKTKEEVSKSADEKPSEERHDKERSAERRPRRSRFHSPSTSWSPRRETKEARRDRRSRSRECSKSRERSRSTERSARSRERSARSRERSARSRERSGRSRERSGRSRERSRSRDRSARSRERSRSKERSRSRERSARSRERSRSKERSARRSSRERDGEHHRRERSRERRRRRSRSRSRTRTYRRGDRSPAAEREERREESPQRSDRRSGCLWGADTRKYGGSRFENGLANEASPERRAPDSNPDWVEKQRRWEEPTRGRGRGFERGRGRGGGGGNWGFYHQEEDNRWQRNTFPGTGNMAGGDAYSRFNENRGGGGGGRRKEMDEALDRSGWSSASSWAVRRTLPADVQDYYSKRERGGASGWSRQDEETAPAAEPPKTERPPVVVPGNAPPAVPVLVSPQLMHHYSALPPRPAAPYALQPPPVPVHLHTAVPLLQVPATAPQGLPPPPPPPPPIQQGSQTAANQPAGTQPDPHGTQMVGGSATTFVTPLFPSPIKVAAASSLLPTSTTQPQHHKVDSSKKEKKQQIQEKAINEVKSAIKPYYQNNEINKEEYKEIVRKAVDKVCHSKSGEVNSGKVANLVKAYVDKYKHARKK